MPGSGVDNGAKDVQSGVGIEWGGCGRDSYGGSGCGTDGGGGVYIWDGDRDKLILWEDNV